MSPSGCSWGLVNQSPSVIAVTNPVSLSGSGDATIAISLVANNTGQPVPLGIAVTDGSQTLAVFSITQNAACFPTLTPNPLEFPSTGGALNLQVSTNGVPCYWIFSFFPSFITTPLPSQYYQGDQTVSLTASPNSGTSPLSGGVDLDTVTSIFFGAEVIVDAASPLPNLLVDGNPSSEYFYPVLAATDPPASYQVKLTTSDGSAVQFTVTPSASWLTVTDANNLTTPDTLTITVNPQGLTPGESTAFVDLFATGAQNAPYVGVALTVTGAPVFSGIDDDTFTVGQGDATINIYGVNLDINASLLSASWTDSSGTTTPLTVTPGDSTRFTADVPAALLASVEQATLNVADGSVSASFPQYVIPEFDSITPSSVEAGSGAFTLTANGKGFDSNTSFNGGSDNCYLSSKFVSSTVMQCTVSNTEIASPTTLGIDIDETFNGSGVFVDERFLTVTPSTTQPTLTAVPGSTPFTYTIGGSAPSAQTITVTSENPGSGVNFTTTTSGACSWLNLSPANGGTTAVGGTAVTASVLTSVAGTLLPSATPYNCTITFSATGVSPSPTVTASLTVSAPTTLTSSAPSLSFAYTLNGSAPATQTFNVTSTNPATGLVFTTTPSGSCAWLTLSPASGGTTTQQIQASVNTAAANALQASATPYNCTLTLSASGVSPSPTVTASITVSAAPTLTPTPASLSFAYTLNGAAPAAQTISVTSAPSSGLAFTTTPSGSCAWLTLSPTGGGTTTQPIQASVNTAAANALQASTTPYNCTLTLSATGVSPSPTVTASITVSAAPTLTPTPASLSFSYTVNGAAPGAQTFTLTSANPATGLAFSTSPSGSCGWLTLSPSSGGTTTQAIQASVNTSVANTLHASATPYICTLTLSASGVSPSSTVTASLTVSVAPTLMPSIPSLSFPYTLNGSAPTAQAFTLTSANPATGLAFTITTAGACGWLTLSPLSGGTTPQAVQASVNTAAANALQASATPYNCILTLSAAGVSASPTVTASITVSAPQTTLAATPGGVQFNYAINGTAPGAQAVTVSSMNPSSGLSFTVSSGNCSWLTSAPAQEGTTGANGNVSLSVNTTAANGLLPNTYACIVTFSAKNEALTARVTATLTLSAAVVTPTIAVSPPSYSFGSFAAGAIPQSITDIRVTVSPAALSYSATPSANCAANSNWLSLSGLGGTGSGTITATPSTNLTAGSYACTLTVSAAGAMSQTVNFTLTVTPAVSTALTFVPSSLNFSLQPHAAAPAPVNVVATSASAGAAYSISATSWVIVSPPSGTTPGTFSVTVDPEQLTTGVNTGTITVTPQGGSPQAITVIATLSALPALTVSPPSIALQPRAGDAATVVPVAVLGITSLNSSEVQVGYTATVDSGTPFLSITSGGNGQTPASFVLRIDPGSLTAGKSYQGSVLVTAPGANPSSVEIPVAVTMQAPDVPAKLQVNLVGGQAGVYTLSATTGVTKPAGSLQISNTGGLPLTYSAKVSAGTGGNWLSLTSTPGTVNPGGANTLSFAADATIPGAGTWESQIAIGDTANTADPPQTITVVLSVPAAQTVTAPRIGLSQTGLQFAMVAGTTPPPQLVEVYNANGGLLPWSTAASTLPAGGCWLNPTPAGAAGTPLTVAVKASCLTSPGTYYGSVQVLANGASNSPQFITVVVNVKNPQQSLSPSVTPGGAIIAAGNSQGIQIFNPSPSRPANYTTTAVNLPDGTPAPWLSLDAPSGAVPAGQSSTVNISVGTSLQQTQYGQIVFAFDDGSTQRVTVAGQNPSATPSQTIAQESAKGTEGGPKPASNSGCQATVLDPVFVSPTSGQNLIPLQPVPIDLLIKDNCGNPLNAGAAAVTFSYSGSYTLTPSGAGDGHWTGTWNPPLGQGPNVTLQAHATSQLASSTALFTSANPPTVQVVLVSSTSPKPPQLNAITNGATFLSNTEVAPGSIVTLWVSGLPSGVYSQRGFPLPTMLKDVQVLLGGQPLRLLYQDGNQINAVIPTKTLTANLVNQLVIQQVQTNVQAVPLPLTVGPLDPGVFTVGDHYAAATIYGTNGSFAAPAGAIPNAPSRPAAPGDILVIYCTGLGAVQTPPADGYGASGTPPDAITSQPISVSIGGVNAKIQFAGLSPGYSGLYQINAQVDGSTPVGDSQPLIVTVNGAHSLGQARVAVQ